MESVFRIQRVGQEKMNQAPLLYVHNAFEYVEGNAGYLPYGTHSFLHIPNTS